MEITTNLQQIGMLRQWLNEKPADRMVTNADILLWLTNNKNFADHIVDVAEMVLTPKYEEIVPAVHSQILIDKMPTPDYFWGITK